MAGHSKWANIKKRKGAQDKQRGKLFTKLSTEIQVAAKMGGPDPDANPRLRLAIDKARSNSMPKSTIQGAIDKATDDRSGDAWEDLTYEGYGPGGVAILVECLTDNRNRTGSAVKAAFSKGGGNLGSPGSVAYQFTRKGQFVLPAGELDEDTVLEAALQGGGDDLRRDGTEWVVTSPFEQYDSCKGALEQLNVEVKAELTQIADNEVEVALSDAKALMALLELLDDLDDVQETYTNADFDDEVAAALEAE